MGESETPRRSRKPVVQVAPGVAEQLAQVLGERIGIARNLGQVASIVAVSKQTEDVLRKMREAVLPSIPNLPDLSHIAPLSHLSGASATRGVWPQLDAVLKNALPLPAIEHLQAQVGVVRGHSGVLGSVRLAAAAIQEATNGLRFADRLEAPLKALREAFEGYEADERRLLEAIVPRGWLISPSMGMGMIRQLARELDERDVAEIDSALVRWFNPDRCQEIIDRLYDDAVFEQYRGLLDEGITVHGQGQHRAAILVWLAAIDGIAEQKFGVRRIFAEAKRKNGGRLRVEIERTTTGHEALHDALIEILKRASVKDPDLHVPKRDRVMHGRDVDFGNERASIQLVLVLEVLHFCAAFRRDPDEADEPELVAGSRHALAA